MGGLFKMRAAVMCPLHGPRPAVLSLCHKSELPNFCKAKMLWTHDLYVSGHSGGLDAGTPSGTCTWQHLDFCTSPHTKQNQGPLEKQQAQVWRKEKSGLLY